MQVFTDTASQSITIHGFTFNVPTPITADMFTADIETVMPTEYAVSILNKLLVDNIRNNFNKYVSEAILAEAAKLGSKVPKVSLLSKPMLEKALAKVDTAALAAQFTKYIKAYVPGERRTSGKAPVDPVIVEARRLATDMVKDYLEETFSVGRTARSATYKAWDAQVQKEMGMSGAEYIDKMVDELIETNPAILETAKQNIAAKWEWKHNIQVPTAFGDASASAKDAEATESSTVLDPEELARKVGTL